MPCHTTSNDALNYSQRQRQSRIAHKLRPPPEAKQHQPNSTTTIHAKDEQHPRTEADCDEPR
ncbi:uncharacterized protein LACBIDRAFT_298072 [Laccaria bicolor S238N-H82]|uniref:Predicted protein n=1 Tax=Laccaria bicolor (strain S238N-H82 / ATCC MYA-4686) TaxID=486041 RepID=B0DC63_LACBS|nr:uncharacterized protein LACBIDRAFT_298072 [Laccaria bicolor S238N-H82]EDR07837.1 predicted protein [Laccaria bicolor S238N-H82]|eukprot:XP_001881626.1 predicted protein [Laccaria bicolor S238N-H82]